MILETEQLPYWRWLHEFDLLNLNQENVFIPDFKFDEDLPSPYNALIALGDEWLVTLGMAF